MGKRSIYIIVIDDNMSEDEPLVVELREKYDNVKVFRKASEGLKFVLGNLEKKLIVLVDIHLGLHEPDGFKIIRDIRKQTSLVHVIVMTANIQQVKSKELAELVNLHAFAFLDNTEDYSSTIDIIDSAAHSLEIQVDSVIEEWISKHSPTEREKPYLSTKEGKVYTLNDVLKEIRHQTEFGKKMQKNIMLLTIDLLARGKKQVDD